MTFRNIAGRCGRAGAFTEGDTILFENRGGPPEAFRGVAMDTQLATVMFGSAPIESTAGDKYQVLGLEERMSIRSVFSSQLLASIKENEGADDIVELLSNSTYAIRDKLNGSIRSILDESLGRLLDASGAGGAFAVMNSPVCLTPLGETANLSGFSPDSVREILKYLLAPNKYSSEVELIAHLLIHFSHLDEQ